MVLDAKRRFYLKKLRPIRTILRDTVQVIKVEEVYLIGEREGCTSLLIAILLTQRQTSTGFRLAEAMLIKYSSYNLLQLKISLRNAASLVCIIFYSIFPKRRCDEMLAKPQSNK